VQRATSKPKRGPLISACVVIFLIALGVRLLYWQDMRSQFLRKDEVLRGMTLLYELEARRILDQGGILFPNVPVDRSDARMISHPPGYPILMAAVLALMGEERQALRFIQVLADAGAAVLVLLIAAELLPVAVAIIAAILVALSPHFAYYSMLLLPDSMAVLPILLAVYLLARARNGPGLVTAITIGALAGVSCWLRSNALLLAPFLAIGILVLVERGKRLRCFAALVSAALIIVAPITIRNLVVYHHFIPLSLGAGVTFMKGFADYDPEGRFGLPLTDAQVVEKEAEWYDRPDYARHLWVPDGVERDRDRFARGVAIARQNPGWFLSAMWRRMWYMLRYNDFRPQNIRHQTTLGPTVSPSPNFGHYPAIPDDAAPVWSSSPADLISNGTVVSAHAQATLAGDGKSLDISCDSSRDESLFSSMPIAVERTTDYVLALQVNLEQGPIDINIRTPDPRIVLAIVGLPSPEKKTIRARKKAGNPIAIDDPAVSTLVQVPFASGDTTEVRVLFTTPGASSVRPAVHVYRAEMFSIGPTPHLWTRYPRAVIGGLQKNLFRTEHLLSIVLIGVVLVALSGHGRSVAILLVVPVYYLAVHSAFHTEYRYILAMHYPLFIAAATTLYCLGVALSQAAQWARLKGARALWPVR
jgi:dolichyl-phosphate-mannose-protein mannosyltransferase